MALAKQIDLASGIESVKTQIKNLHQKAADLRAELKDLKRAPLTLSEVVKAARAEADVLKNKAQEALAFRFNKRDLVDDPKFFDRIDAGNLDELRTMFIAAGGLHSLIDEREKIPAQRDAMTGERKTTRLRELEKELQDVERGAEAARTSLEKEGFESAPDEFISPTIFLEFDGGKKFNATKLRQLNGQATALHAVTDRCITYGSNLQLDIIAARTSLRHIRESHVTTPDDRKKLEARIGELEKEANANRAKVAEHQKKTKAINRILTRCEQFLRDRGIEFPA